MLILFHHPPKSRELLQNCSWCAVASYLQLTTVSDDMWDLIQAEDPPRGCTILKLMQFIYDIFKCFLLNSLYWWYGFFISYNFLFMTLLLYLICIYCYSKFIKYYSLFCTFGTVFISTMEYCLPCCTIGNVLSRIKKTIFWLKYCTTNVSLKCVVIYEQYVVFTVIMVYISYIITQNWNYLFYILSNHKIIEIS